MKRDRPIQESLHFAPSEQKPASAVLVAGKERAKVLDLSAKRARAKEKESVTVALISDVCGRASHLSDVFVERNLK